MKGLRFVKIREWFWSHQLLLDGLAFSDRDPEERREGVRRQHRHHILLCYSKFFIDCLRRRRSDQ